MKTPSQFKAWDRITGLVFTLSVFLSAALLFLVEPMVGKMVLPLLGGSPAVWTTCMLFFQGALLLGYGYAHLGPRWLGVRRHILLHIGLLALALLLLPIGIREPSGLISHDHPIAWLLAVLGLSLGFPFVLLSSTGPLVQVWFSRTSHPQAGNPYFLYAASNAGSLLALLAYPFLLEPIVPLTAQARLWSMGYLALIGLIAIAGAYSRRQPVGRVSTPVARDGETRVRAGTVVRWTLLAFVPSSFLLALTTYITTDIASVPLLWIIPLVLYLLSFSLVFGRRSLVSQRLLARWLPVGLIALAILSFWGPSPSTPWLLPLHLIVFFMTSLSCHGELAATKPPASRLTEFYLCIAVGGVLGGIFNALAAPVLFDSVLEYPLTLVLACAMGGRLSDPGSPRPLRWDLVLITSAALGLLATRVGFGDRQAPAAAVVASVAAALICLRMSRDRWRFTLAIAGVVTAGILAGTARPGVLLKERNFFGVREVREYAGKRIHVLMHGTTNHGSQRTDPDKRSEPIGYYHREGPLGDIFRALPPRAGRRVAVIGLGAGGMAAYGGVGETWTFYEIDPDIARVARDTTYFTYLRDTPATVEVVLGDGRLSLAGESSQFDLIILDAFTSDAIPIHLLTLEALAVYQSRLSATGALIFHLSNRYLDLEPVLARLLHPAGLTGLIRANTGPTAAPSEFGPARSVWAAAAREPGPLTALQRDPRWRPLRMRDGVGLWTDDFSNIFSVVRWPRSGANRAATGEGR